MGRLEVHTKERGRRSEVEFDGPLTVGRSRENDVVLRDMKVSRHHCVIEPVNGVCKVRDTGSSTGTWVNRKRVTECEIRNGDRIRVGEFDLRYFGDRVDELDDTALAMDDDPPKRTNGVLDGQRNQPMSASDGGPEAKSSNSSALVNGESQTRIAALEEELKARCKELISLRESLSQLKTSAANDAQSLQAELIAKQTECESVREEADAHLKALREAHEIADAISQRSHDQEVRLKDVTAESARRLNRIEAIQSELAVANTDADQLRESLRSSVEREQALQSEIDVLSEESSSLREELDVREKALAEVQLQSAATADDRERALVAEITDLQQRIGDLSAEPEELKQQIKKLRAEIKTGEEAIKNVEGQLKSARNDTEERVSALEGEAEDLRQEVATLGAEREDLVKKANDLKQQLANRDASLKAMSAQLEAAESAKIEREQFEVEIAKLRDEIAKANKAVSHAKNDCEAAQNETVRLQSAMQAQESAARVLSVRQATLQKDYDALAETLESREQEARDAGRRAEEAKRKLELQLNHISMLESELEAARDRSTHVEAEANSGRATLQASIESLQNELVDREQEAAVLWERLAKVSKGRTEAVREPATEPTPTTNVTEGSTVGPLVDSLTGKTANVNGAASSATKKTSISLPIRGGLPVYPEDRDYLTWVVVGVVAIAVITLLLVVVIRSFGG